jgi:DNA-binding MltR family transcriptional regulator
MSKRRYLKAFNDLIGSEPTLLDLPMMEVEFYGESGRAVILLSATLADLALEVALKRLFRNHNSTHDLFDHESPLGSFSSRIKIAFALNLFDKKTNHDLELIRRLRNGFAHDRRHLTFATPQVADMCKHLILPDTDYARNPEAYLSRAKDVDAASDMSSPKTRYVTTCNTIAVALITYGRLPRDLPEMTPGTSLPRLP